MKTLIGPVLALLICNMTFAKAPVVENHSLTLGHRLPAQSNTVGLLPLEHYMDASCEQLVAGSASDGFSLYLKREFTKLDPNFCSLVGELNGEDSFSQADQRKVGLGTFSKLVEGHYHEYAETVELEFFQDMRCEEYMKATAGDSSFKSFFKAQLSELGSDICSRIGNFEREDGADKIGLGTYSKLIETAYWDFNYQNREYR